MNLTEYIYSFEQSKFDKQELPRFLFIERLDRYYQNEAENILVSFFWQVLKRNFPYYSKSKFEGFIVPTDYRSYTYVITHEDYIGNGNYFHLGDQFNTENLYYLFDQWRSEVLRFSDLTGSRLESEVQRDHYLRNVGIANYVFEYFDERVILEILRSTRLPVLVLPKIPRQLTSRSSGGCIKVLNRENEIVSTVGICTTSRQSDSAGITLSRHSFTRNSSGSLKGIKLLIDGQVFTIIHDDPITDFCFAIPHDKNFFDGKAIKKRSDILCGVSPRKHERASFYGATSGPVDTTIIGWSDEIPIIFENSQLKVLTPAVTNEGDSGAALYDSDGKVVGFSFYTTGRNPRGPEFAAWIWAHSAIEKFDLGY